MFLTRPPTTFIIEHRASGHVPKNARPVARLWPWSFRRLVSHEPANFSAYRTTPPSAKRYVGMVRTCCTRDNGTWVEIRIRRFPLMSRNGCTPRGLFGTFLRMVSFWWSKRTCRSVLKRNFGQFSFTKLVKENKLEKWLKKICQFIRFYS